ncbi:hypothetical protein DNTS_029914 [Danionella cerebrum]|uniref:C-type lectin domain-containing protein n=1 Tax=Danionella cerebrum TaxID=2873325 RepID=A0A553QXZ2_9TELE|nr:hypothetical protein DNTS_029914 [Danionella translucida]
MEASVVMFLTCSLFSMHTSAYRKHFYVKQGMTWPNAQVYCRELHDDLSTTSNAELIKLSRNPSLTFGFYWIGLYRESQTPTVWRWIDGEEATNISWQPGQPHTLHELCAFISKSNNRAFDMSCFLSIPFYCMEIYELILVQEERTWDEALAHCKENSMNLAGLTSEIIMEEAMTKSESALTDVVWMGLRFIAGQWFWVKGITDDEGFKGWSAEGEPALNQRCGVYNRTQNVLEAADCSRRLSFLCVRRIKEATNESDA